MSECLRHNDLRVDVRAIYYRKRWCNGDITPVCDTTAYLGIFRSSGLAGGYVVKVELALIISLLDSLKRFRASRHVTFGES
jgi:hypothetical protein